MSKYKLLFDDLSKEMEIVKQARRKAEDELYHQSRLNKRLLEYLFGINIDIGVLVDLLTQSYDPEEKR